MGSNGQLTPRDASVAAHEHHGVARKRQLLHHPYAPEPLPVEEALQHAHILNVVYLQSADAKFRVMGLVAPLTAMSCPFAVEPQTYDRLWYRLTMLFRATVTSSQWNVSQLVQASAGRPWPCVLSELVSEET